MKAKLHQIDLVLPLLAQVVLVVKAEAMPHQTDLLALPLLVEVVLALHLVGQIDLSEYQFFL